MFSQKEKVKLERGIRGTLAIAVACALAAPAVAQTWPAQTVRIISPFTPGGGTDLVGRLLAQKLIEQTGGSFVVENRPGAAATIGAAVVAKAQPDGYTLLISAPEMSIHPNLRSTLPYDPLKDFACISQLTSGQFVLASHPAVPVKTVKQLIALAKARPGQLNYASSGTGAITHLSGELFQLMAGVRWTHVPFRGAGAAVIALMGGETDFVIASTAAVVGQVSSGKLRAIAVTGPKRFTEIPDVPTIAESLPGYEVTGWYGLYAPAGTSADIVQRLFVESRRALTRPEVKETLMKTGNEPVVSSPQEFAVFLRAEIAKWAKVVKSSGLKEIN
jgi:tripartite-type tricarboxylate transporter receptor subunit TctC